MARLGLSHRGRVGQSGGRGCGIYHLKVVIFSRTFVGGHLGGEGGGERGVGEGLKVKNGQPKCARARTPKSKVGSKALVKRRVIVDDS